MLAVLACLPRMNRKSGPDLRAHREQLLVYGAPRVVARPRLDLRVPRLLPLERLGRVDADALHARLVVSSEAAGPRRSG